jgi:hypothetical protein
MRIPATVSEDALRRIEVQKALRDQKSAANKAKREAFFQGALGALPIIGQGAATLYSATRKTNVPPPPPSAGGSGPPPMSRGDQSRALDARNWSAPPAAAPAAGLGSPSALSAVQQAALDPRQWRQPPAQSAPPQGGAPARGGSATPSYSSVSPYLQSNADALLLRLILGV